MYSPKEICKILDIPYETLKFYCKEGLVPNVQRDKNNQRVFDERNLGWLQGLMCLRKCGMSLKDMKIYMEYCKEGMPSIPQRKEMLAATREELLIKQQEIQEAIDYIDNKQQLFDDMQSGKVPYHSNIIDL